MDVCVKFIGSTDPSPVDFAIYPAATGITGNPAPYFYDPSICSERAFSPNMAVTTAPIKAMAQLT